MATNKIILSNITDNDSICHSFLVIKGKIEHDNSHPTPIDNALKITLNEETINDYRIKNSQFKVLVELKINENEVKFSYCCLLHSLKIKYTKRHTEYTVTPLYIINKRHSGNFQAPENLSNTPESACKRILTVTKLLQCFIAEKLKEDGFERKTFELDEDKCTIFHSHLDDEDVTHMGQRKVWRTLAREIMNSKIGNQKKKFLGFLSCTRYKPNGRNLENYEDMIKATQGYIALGGGGLALFGTACLYTWPECLNEVLMKFEDDTPVDTGRFLNDSCYRNTQSACFSTTLGSVLHELCHTFDLGHTKDGVMGRGFDNIYKFFTMQYLAEDKCEKSKVKTNYNTITPKLSNGVIRHPKNITYVDIKTKAIDETYFTYSCTALLSYHKFFNSYPHSNLSYVLKFDPKTKFIRSTVGIRVIEIREHITEMVARSWFFSGRVLKYSFQIPEDCVDNILVVEDNVGNIIKEDIT